MGQIDPVDTTSNSELQVLQDLEWECQYQMYDRYSGSGLNLTPKEYLFFI